MEVMIRRKSATQLGMMTHSLVEEWSKQHGREAHIETAAEAINGTRGLHPDKNLDGLFNPYRTGKASPSGGNPIGESRDRLGGLGGDARFENFIERLMGTLPGGRGAFHRGDIPSRPSRLPGGGGFGAVFQGNPQIPSGGWLTPPGTNRDHDDVAEGRLNPTLPSDPDHYRRWQFEQDLQAAQAALQAQMSGWGNSPSAFADPDAEKKREMKDAIREAYRASGGDPNKSADEIVAEAQAEAQKREDERKREEERKKEEERKYQIPPKKGSNPNPDDPGDGGPGGPWVRTRVTSPAYRSSNDLFTPNPDGPPGPDGPWMLYMPNPDDPGGGPGPAGPWSRMASARSSRFASVAKPNPDDPRGDGGPRGVVSAFRALSTLRR
jgi:hypothetical protein